MASGAMMGEIMDSTAQNRRQRAAQSLPPKPRTMEFQASSRRSSLKKPNYYRLSTQPKPKRQSVNSKVGGFSAPAEIDQVFNIYPKKATNLPEYPSYMIEYFVKNFDLLKKNPNIDYQVLKAKIDVPKIAQIVETERTKRHASMPNPVFNQKVQQSAERLQKLNRQSAPADIKFRYEPIRMSMDEYLNTPLDLYRHRKNKKSVGSDHTFNTNTSSSGGHTQSGISSVDTGALGHVNRLGNERVLKTERKDSLVHRKSVQFSGSIIPEEKLESSYEKFGVSPVPLDKKHKSREVSQFKRMSHHGDISIESGRDVYNTFKKDLFSQNYKTWQGMAQYIEREYPEYYGNEYIMTRLILEIYTRRVIAGRIAIKIATDREKRNSDGILSGLKEVITGVYGAQQASII